MTGESTNPELEVVRLLTSPPVYSTAEWERDLGSLSTAGLELLLEVYTRPGCRTPEWLIECVKVELARRSAP